MTLHIRKVFLPFHTTVKYSSLTVNLCRLLAIAVMGWVSSFLVLLGIFVYTPSLLFAEPLQDQHLPPETQVHGSHPDSRTVLDIKGSPLMVPTETPLGTDESDAMSRALKNAIATQPEVPASAGILGNSIVTQEIQYTLAEAGEVDLVWWVDGWNVLPEGRRPPGTVVHNGSMATSMRRTGHTFTTRLDVPIGTYLNYCFHITKTRENKPIDVWDTNGYPPRNYQTIARAGSPAVVLATLDLEKAQIETNRIYAPLVTQEIRYHASGAGEVSLVWGINGWQPVSEAIRPLGTVVKDRPLMRTPMVHKEDAFIAKVQVPSGAIIDYGFLITKTNRGAETESWDGAPDYTQTVTRDGIIDVNSKVGHAMQGTVQSEPPGNASENSGMRLQQEYPNRNVYWLVLVFLVLNVSVLVWWKFRKTSSRGVSKQ